MNDCFSLPEDPYEDMGFLFWQTIKSWQRAKNKMLEEFKITPSQMEVLSAIYYLQQKKEEEITQIAISNLTSIDPMTTSSVLKILEKKELINRESSSSDTRARKVSLTSEGNNLLIKALTKVKNSTSHIFDVVDKKALNKELRILLNILNKTNYN